MDIDIVASIGAVDRAVVDRRHAGGRERVVTVGRAYDAPVDDVWDALTSAERIARWHLPVSGDLCVGGRYQLEGSAGGEILECERPHHVRVTWEHGGDISWVDVRLRAEPGGGTYLRLEHLAPDGEAHWDEYGPGAVGVGWDLTLVGLQRHLATGDRVDPEWETSPAAQGLVRLSSSAWCRAAIASGAPEAAALLAAERTTAAYTGES